ncbi:glutaconate CoA-transferase subunit A [Lipingzhangella halophila]|uniref:Glutaconate CoA-transferase subunit A n=1 Tax=Lipingzhangella halophila TaxID=1783352 RepID=A0A7W7W3M3_9ACTN|nr:CoA transferase subunit A [Lipingzhangella halophila]MBB4932668.1 glutaconate CoA-transferase subunit A [Lipingzhangella halophila]
MPASKTATMRDAIAEHVDDGDTVALEGFTHLIPVAAGHELIRQRRRNLTIVRMTPDIVFDQLVAAGAATKMIFSFTGNSSVGSLHAIRRAIEHSDPRPLQIEEYSHFGLLGRYIAGASNLPFYPLRSAGGDLLAHNPNIGTVVSPFPASDGGTEEVHAVPPLHPDVAIVHAQRADRLGNVQAWGILGPQQEVAFAARRTIAVVEEVADDSVIRSDPNRTTIPGLAVDAVVECPRGAHPSFVQGYYDRDNEFYRAWPAISRDPDALRSWLQEWVYDLPDHAAYLAKLGPAYFDQLRPVPAMSSPVDYGSAP